MILLIAGSIMCVSVAFAPQVLVGLDQSIALPRDSYLNKYFDWMNEYLQVLWVRWVYLCIERVGRLAQMFTGSLKVRQIMLMLVCKMKYAVHQVAVTEVFLILYIHMQVSLMSAIFLLPLCLIGSKITSHGCR